ncbi:MAG: signal peptide peptidase SppA [Alphaproteobacteria bacterium]|nr:signal peptide peptidase SppA [Alphaproteobacteria bacterium]
MNQETEGILDRRRLRRKLGLWRGLAIIAGVLAVGALALIGSGAENLTKSDQIARVGIEGLITEDRKQIELLKSIAKADHVKGVIVYVNSPGGTTTGGEALFRNLRDISKKKPVVAQFGTVAASAAYIAGLGTDYIVARGNSITGSVGVIMQWPEFSGLLDKVGVTMHTVKSGSLKAEPSPFKPVDPETRKLLDQMIGESFRWFVGLVETRRNVTVDTIPGLREGRVFSGREALQYKLVDAIGGEDEARSYLEEKANLPANLQIIDWKPKKDLDWPFGGSLANSVTRILAGWLGVGTLASVPGGGLDGMISVWHPQKR